MIVIVLPALISGVLTALALGTLKFSAIACASLAFVAAALASVIGAVVMFQSPSEDGGFWWALRLVGVSAGIPLVSLTSGAVLSRKVFHD